MLEGLKEHGIQGTKIGLDGELYPSQIAKAAKILPGIEFVDVSKILMDMREVKTPEELEFALIRKEMIKEQMVNFMVSNPEMLGLLKKLLFFL